MKILALRVRNLTSLAGEIAVDFEAPPLANAGLFAITGPTGAGKSTLLDALCLALYDRLPRLSGHGDDVRSVLRHGTAEACAEVDFVGRDGGRYRARWEVRRARNRVNGTVQAQKMSLTDLATNTPLGGTKRETLEAIESKVGLDYQQFRRSVLLAQNDFDAFLRAKPDDRAGLLELMTGTAIYGELSRAAFDRSKAEEAALRLLDEELKRVNVLADDDRAAVEAETAAAEQHATHLADEVEGLAREIEWYRVGADLAARVAEAETRLAEAATRLAEAQPERERMAQVRRALTASPLVDEADRLSADIQRLERDGAQAAQVLAQRQQALTDAAARRDAARIADEQADAALRAAGPLLDQAADLDSRMAEGQARLARCRDAARHAEAAAAQAETDLRTLNAGRDAAAAAIAERERWLAGHAGHGLLAEQAERWLDQIAAHGKAAADHQRARQQAADAARRLDQLAAQVQDGARQGAALETRLGALDEIIAGLNRHLGALDLEGLDRRYDGLTALDRALADLETLAAAAAGLDARDAELRQHCHTVQARLDRADADLAVLDERLRHVRAALPEAQRMLALTEAAEGKQADALRQRLIDGEPCPVCGARQHALQEVHSALGGLLAEQRQRVAALEAERDDLTRRQAEAAAHRRADEESLSLARRDAARLGDDRHAVAARWREAAASVAQLAQHWLPTLPPVPEAPAAGLGLDAARAEGERLRAQVNEQLRGARAAEAERSRALHERENLRGEQQRLTAHLAQAAQDRATAETERQMAGAAQIQAAAEMARLADILAEPLAPLGDWRALLPDPAALAARVRALAGEWRKTVEDLERRREAARTLDAQCASAAVAVDNARRNADKDGAARDGEQKALDHLTAARAVLFDGRPTAAVRQQLEGACRARKHDLAAAQEAWATAGQAHSAAESQLRMLAEAQATAARALETAAAARDARLAEIGLDLPEMRAAMVLGDAWMTAAEARQTALREAETTGRAILDERRQALADHQAASRPQRAAEELAALLPARAAERDAARDRLAQLRQRLADDDRNRGAAADTRARIAAQRQRHDLWKGICDLIGSADGKKFRMFAQGLTLDRLLGLANLHLAELTTRYVLRRAPGAALDLEVIDRDMADEVRAVANLSGGERFLVSLSLALGLASMTGSRTIAESLFIDEGFGALDAESLDVAIGALETLHASGRKVGVISHVQAMIDRIGVQVRITKLGGGRSVVETRAA